MLSINDDHLLASLNMGEDELQI